MWEFIKYCLRCLLMSISAAFGNNPEGMTFKHAIVGIVTISLGDFMVNSGNC